MFTTQLAAFGLVCLVVCSARAEPSWKQVPPLTKGKLDPHTAARFGELLAALDNHETRIRAFGEPTHDDTNHVHWERDGFEVSIAEGDANAVYTFELDGAGVAPALTSLPLLDSLRGSTCDAVLSALGAPTWSDGGSTIYSFRRGDVPAHLVVECSEQRVKKVSVLPPHRSPWLGVTTAPSKLPAKTYTGVAFASTKGPKKQSEVWPFGLGGGPTLGVLVQTWGEPLRTKAETGRFGWNALADWDEPDANVALGTARVTAIRVFASERPVLAARGLKGRELAWLGGPRTAMEKALGPPTIATGDKVVWLYATDGEHLSIEADVEDDGSVGSLLWVLHPNGAGAFERCGFDLLARRDAAARSKAIVFDSTKPAAVAAVATPFGLSHPIDIVRRFGEPKRCGSLEYPGFNFFVFDDRIQSMTVSGGAAEWLASRGLEPEFAVLVGSDARTFQAHFGLEERETSFASVEASRGQNGARLSAQDLDNDGRYDKLQWYASNGPKLDDFITGLRLYDWTPPAAQAQPGAHVTLLGALEVTTEARGWLDRERIGGPAVTVLGRPWLDAINTLGKPSYVSLETEKRTAKGKVPVEPRIKLTWSADGREIYLLCEGPNATCSTLGIRGREGGVLVD